MAIASIRKNRFLYTIWYPVYDFAKNSGLMLYLLVSAHYEKSMSEDI